MPITCSKCGKELPDDAQFCSECGTAVETEKKPDYCSNCFSELPEGVKFCLQCGKSAVVVKYPVQLPQWWDDAIRKELYERASKDEYYDIVKRPSWYGDGEVIDFEENKARLSLRA